MAEKLDLTGFRNETWNPTIEYGYSGDTIDFAGATIALQWRLYPGAPGDPLIDLPTDGALTFEDVAATAEEIAAGEAPADGRFLRIYPELAVALLADLPTGLNEPEPGEADVYAWDAVITFADTTTWTPLAGDVLLSPGVTTDGP